MNQFVAIFMAGALSLFLSCKGEEVPVQQAQAETPSGPVEGLFKPPTDSIISIETAKKFVDASNALYMLARTWIARMEQASDPQDRILILSGFEKARDQVVRKIGLQGIEEFKWISQSAMKNPKNQKILNEAGLKARIK